MLYPCINGTLCYHVNLYQTITLGALTCITANNQLPTCRLLYFLLVVMPDTTNRVTLLTRASISTFPSFSFLLVITNITAEVISMSILSMSL